MQSDRPRISPYLSQNGAPSPAKQRFERRAKVPATLAGYAGFAVGYLMLSYDHRSILPRDNLYEAVRIGMGGKEWRASKLRTMPKNTEHGGRSATKADSSRIENLVRKTALDEVKELRLLNIAGAERPELPTDREAQRDLLMEAGLSRVLHALEAGREVVEPSATSAAALYGHLPFEQPSAEWPDDESNTTTEASLIMRSMLSAHYYETAQLETDKQLLFRTIPELRRINTLEPGCGALDMIKGGAPESLVGSIALDALRLYPEGAGVLLKMGQFELPRAA